MQSKGKRMGMHLGELLVRDRNQLAQSFPELTVCQSALFCPLPRNSPSSYNQRCVAESTHFQYLLSAKRDGLCVWRGFSKC